MTCECWKNYGADGRHNVKDCNCDCHFLNGEHPHGECKFCKSIKLVKPIYDNMSGLTGWYHNRQYKIANLPSFCIDCGKMNATNSFIRSGFKEESSCTKKQLHSSNKWTKEDYN